MDTNKKREQFESAWRARYPEHGEIALKRSGLDPEDYCNTRVKDAWWAWQASREALVVDLPGYGQPDCEDHAEWRHTRNGTIDACARMIEAQGLKVAP